MPFLTGKVKFTGFEMSLRKKCSNIIAFLQMLLVVLEIRPLFSLANAHSEIGPAPRSRFYKFLVLAPTPVPFKKAWLLGAVFRGFYWLQLLLS